MAEGKRQAVVIICQNDPFKTLLNCLPTDHWLQNMKVSQEDTSGLNLSLKYMFPDKSRDKKNILYMFITVNVSVSIIV